MPTDGNLRAQGGGGSSGMAQISTATSASIIYVAASRHFASVAASLDDVAMHSAAEQSRQSQIETELLSTSLAAVMAAFFGVEALLNELFLSHELGMQMNFPGLDSAVAKRLAAAWHSGADRLNPIEKADRALETAGVGKLDRSGRAFLWFSLLHDLRNELVHHKPLWTQHGKPSSSTGDKLGGQLFQIFGEANIWVRRGAAYRWNGCLGGSCAQWAHASGIVFSQLVCDGLGVRQDWLKP